MEMEQALTSAPGPSVQFVFWLLAAMTTFFALLTITRKNPVAAVMSLVATFVSLAAIYATLSAHFAAVLQVLVYAGAIMVLFIFVVMILNREDADPVAFRGILTRLVGAAATVWLFGFALFQVIENHRANGAFAAPPAELDRNFGTVASVGRHLFGDFVFPFEAISVLLLIAIVGGLVVSRSAKQEAQAEAMFDKAEAIRQQITSETRLGPDGRPLPTAGPTSSAGHH